MNTSGARHQSLTRFTHLGPKSRCGATTFYPYFGRGGIGIFGSRKSGSICGVSSPVDIRQALSEGGIQYPSPKIIGEKSDCGTSSFSPLLFYIATPSQAIDAVSQCDIIQESKMQTQSSHGLTSACIFRFLRREPCRQQQIVRPSTTVPKKFHIEPEGTTSLGRRKKPINNSGIPQHEIEHIARCILPDILAYYESEEGQREFREWLAQREAGQTEGKVGRTRDK